MALKAKFQLVANTEIEATPLSFDDATVAEKVARRIQRVALSQWRKSNGLDKKAMPEGPFMPFLIVAQPVDDEGYAKGEAFQLGQVD